MSEQHLSCSAVNTVLLDALSARVVSEVVLRTEGEKARRVPIHMVHRWWSRRFAAVYRAILASYLFESEEKVLEALDWPAAMRERARGKVFFEPFAGGGTGLSEAAIAGFDAYGLDVNPVATTAARAGLLIATRGLPENFRELSMRVLSAARKKTGFSLGVRRQARNLHSARARAPACPWVWVSVSRRPSPP